MTSNVRATVLNVHQHRLWVSSHWSNASSTTLCCKPAHLLIMLQTCHVQYWHLVDLFLHYFPNVVINWIKLWAAGRPQDRHWVWCNTELCSWSILFLLYIADLQLLIEDHGLCPHHFADDIQIYGFCSPMPSSCTELQSRISECIDVVSSWMRSHRLQLNTAKTISSG